MSRFEWMVALRYLLARRKQTVISIITVISILGVAAGVMALIIALAINNGFQSTLQSTLLSATAHVSIQEANPEFGIAHWENLIPRLRRIAHVVSAVPSLYGQVAMKGPLVGAGATIKGVPLGHEVAVPELLHHLKEGSLTDFDGPDADRQIILGSRLAQQLGVKLHSPVSVIGTQLTPLGLAPGLFHYRVAGIFESGLYEIDSYWAFTTLSSAQHLLDLTDVVNSVELRLDNIFEARHVAGTAGTFIGSKLVAVTWMDQNHSLLNALTLEKRVSVITVALIELVAALNILVVLVMFVMEKNRDIAILMSMGARRAQIQRIFILQGLIIGGVGCIIGLTAGYTITTILDRYRILKLDEQVYALSSVPFQNHWTDAIWVTALALATSFVATIHPSRSAARIAPAESLQYE
jgi:lipoprotein-releasing system permease protein